MMAKLDNITALLNTVIARLDSIDQRVMKLENERDALNTRIGDLEGSAVEVNLSLEEIKEKQKRCVGNDEIDILKRRIDELNNRSRRNNVVFWGIPEKSEKSADCCDFIKDFISNHMKVENSVDIEIERAHRSPMGTVARSVGHKQPRPIHVRFLRYSDRELVLRNAGKYLKDNLFKGSKVFISDDVSESVRKDRKKLIKLRNKLRDDGKFALIPWTVPAVLLVKDGRHDGVFKRITVDGIARGTFAEAIADNPAESDAEDAATSSD